MTLHPTLVWFLLSAAGAVLAVGMEVYIRLPATNPAYSLHYPLWFLPPAVVLNFILWHAFREAPSLLVATALFSLCTLAARIAASQLVLGEPIAKGNLATAVLLVAAVVIGKFWR